MCQIAEKMKKKGWPECECSENERQNLTGKLPLMFCGQG